MGAGRISSCGAHTLSAEFNGLPSFEDKPEQYEGQVATVLAEPVMYTGVVMEPEP